MAEVETSGKIISEVGVVDNLTNREWEILRLICDGFSNKEIALKLNVSVSTVKKHNSEMFKKLNVTTRMQAILEVAKRLDKMKKEGRILAV